MSRKKYQYIVNAAVCSAFLINSSLSKAEHKFIYDCDEITSHLSTKYPSLEKDLTELKTSSGYNLVGIGLFSGKDPISYSIKALSHSKVSHVGIILSDVQDERKWYCFESTGSLGEVLRGKYPHVRITPWKDVVREYKGGISYRLFDFGENERTDPALVTSFVEEYDGKSYTKNPLRLFKALWNKNRKSKSLSLKTVFCSELAAKMLMNLEILIDGVDSNILPRNFKSGGRMSLSSGVTLTPVYKVK